MKTMAQKYREDMRRFARRWRARGLEADRLLAMHFRDQANGWAANAVPTIDIQGVTVIFPGASHTNAMDAWLGNRGVLPPLRWIHPTNTACGAPINCFYGGKSGGLRA